MGDEAVKTLGDRPETVSDGLSNELADMLNAVEEGMHAHRGESVDKRRERSEYDYLSGISHAKASSAATATNAAGHSSKSSGSAFRAQDADSDET